MSTANNITAGEVMNRTNRRTFLSYLGATPAVTAFAGAGLFSSPSAPLRILDRWMRRSGVTGHL
jgi:hypothetical protein